MGNVPTGAGNFFPRMPGIFEMFLVWRERCLVIEGVGCG